MALGVARSLATRGVPVVVVHYDERDMADRSRYVTAAIRAPHPEKKTEEFLGLLLGCADRYAGGVIFPTSDESLTVASRYKTVLEEHFIVACPDWEITRRCIDKKLTYAVAEACGVAAPRTIVPRTWEEVKSYAATVEFPCLVKPCHSHLFYEHFKRKMFRVDTPGQLLAVCEQAAAAGLEVMLQELIPGDDAQVVNYNAYAREGVAVTEFTAAHVRNAPPWFGSPRVVLSQDIPEVIAPGRTLLQAIGFCGYACTEFKKDARSGVYKLMEINARHNLSTLLAVHCGINFPWLHYRHLVAGELPAAAPYRQGVYWVDLTRDLGYSAIYLTRERYTPGEYLRPYLRPHVFAILDWRDLRPFIQRVAYLVRQGCGSIFRGLLERLRPSRPRRSDNLGKKPAKGATSWSNNQFPAMSVVPTTTSSFRRSESGPSANAPDVN